MAADLPVVVVAAVIEHEGRFLVSRRPQGTHLAGLWEFPGGKCLDGEAHDRCLAREIREELGVEATVGHEVMVTEHAYPERRVRLHFRRCRIHAPPRAILGQEVRWVDTRELAALDFPPADKELIELLVASKR